MTGPEHYREAERVLRSLSDTSTVARLGAAGVANAAAQAQVHATLALAAATIDAAAFSAEIRHEDQWREALS